MSFALMLTQITLATIIYLPMQSILLDAILLIKAHFIMIRILRTVRLNKLAKNE